LNALIPTNEQLALRTQLYGQIFKLIRRTRSEEEIVREAVDAVANALPEYRVAFSSVDRAGGLVVHYSRNAPSIPSLEGLETQLAAAPLFLEAMFRLETIQVNDPKDSAIEKELAQAEPRLGARGSRLFCPFDESSGRVTLLTLTKPKEEGWDPYLVETVREVGEVMHLLRREARTRELLQTNEERFREFSEHVEAVLWMVDANTHEVLYINSAFEEVWGRSMQSLRDNSFSFIEGVHPEDQYLVWEQVRTPRPRPTSMEYRVLRPDGSVVWVKDSSFPVYDESGALRQLVGIAQDITALKQAETKLEATRAQVISKAKFAAIGEMASGIAHEINNPLAVIAGLTKQLREEEEKKRKPTPNAVEHLLTIEKMVGRISAITKGLRTFSRQTDWDPLAPVAVATLLSETVSMFRPRADKEGAVLELPPPEPGLRVNCRSSEIIQVLLNLLNNALDATESLPERRVGITARSEDGTAFILVTDNGPGVPPGIRENIFQPFFTTKDVGRGTGLGLSISKRIVEDHGGRLALEASGPATTFVVQLPLEKR
jgi:two-component system, cell cycle sensor histidine kinase and response regulator CckA